MKWSEPGPWLAAAALVTVAAIVVLDLRRASSPGPLSAAHAGVAELRGRRGCDACHGAPTLAAACGACHVAIASQLEEQSGFHGALEDGARCARCHSEHLGAGYRPTSEASFALAGFDSIADFEHAHTDFRLTGAHAALACEACHGNAHAEVLAAGQARFLGLEQGCASCHRDAHGGRVVRACEDCHGQTSFTDLSGFAHDALFELEGAHASVGCLECHAPHGPRAIEELAGAAPLPIARACEDCHGSPHSGATAERARAATGARCEACHAGAHASFAEGRAQTSAAEHALFGIALEGPHARLDCAACHGAPERSWSARFPGRGGACEDCHADPHAGQFTVEGRARACLDCHLPHAFVPARFDGAAHAAAGFALEGRHAALACAACHVEPVGGGARVFRGLDARCQACHADAHAGAFDGAALPASVGGREGCARCHDAASFDGARARSFDHSLWTGYELAGAHAQARCEACHTPSARPDAHGRRFGRAPARASCESCHANVHGPAFAAPAGGRDGCARCHTTTSFAPARRGAFEHAAWTGFALDGAHARLDCAACHPQRELADAHGRRFGRVADAFPSALEGCARCHADIHGGAFDAPPAPARIEEREGCARCHDTSGWPTEALEGPGHELFCRFPLLGAHARQACASCHPPDAARPSAVPGLGLPAGARCEDCHADPHAGQLARGGRTDCARCHASLERFDVLAFDHDRDTRFALDERHRLLDCGACHLPAPLAGGGVAVRYKPLGTRCADCHGPDGADR